MDLNSDLLLDRKRLKARLAVWRMAALVTVFAVAAIYASGGKLRPSAAVSDYIAQITLDGTLQDNEDRDAMLADIAKDQRIKALIVRMDSPGGTALAGEEIFLQLRKISAKKPVVAVMRTLCASACYMAALGSDAILAREGTITGSVGVMMQAVEISRLAEKLGVTAITVKSGPYKDVPSMGEPFTPDQRQVVEAVVRDAYDHFVRLIMERRNMDEALVRSLADGRVYTGRQAANLKLIDGIGGREEAVTWLAQNRKINPELDIREIKQKAPLPSLFEVLQQRTGIKFWENSTVGLDGLISIWHPSLVQ